MLYNAFTHTRKRKQKQKKNSDHNNKLVSTQCSYIFKHNKLIVICICWYLFLMHFPLVLKK